MFTFYRWLQSEVQLKRPCGLQWPIGYKEPLNLFWMDKDRLVYGPITSQQELEDATKEMLRTAIPLTIIAGYELANKYREDE